MNTQFEKLVRLLKELFQLDQPDLDFGLYRIMHAKSAEVTQFLDENLLPQVNEAFSLYKTADKVDLEKELAKAIEQAQALGVPDPEAIPKVKELRAKLKDDAVDIGALENEVYDHLYRFFRRYYSEGDFLAKRVYKSGAYAIPYEGEEVKLHWANRDQYYIKTSEYLRDYAFRLRPEDERKPMRVHFRLADATEGEHGNVKVSEGKDRVFILAAPGESGCDFIAEEDGEQGKELVIRFEYRPATLTDWSDGAHAGKSKPPAQKDLSMLVAQRVLAVTDASLASWIAELSKPHVTVGGKKADYTRLEAHITRYNARNTFDYFIHKDLGTFLRRELDFYIKNEVMYLDDVENETTTRVEQYLSKIKVIRKIAGKIIAFLAQLEDFQKKLWLKKKFVVETQYCITVGCIPEAFYQEVADNEAQREEWVRLLGIDEINGDLTTPGYSKPLNPDFLKAHPTLVMNTQNFHEDFATRLLEAMGEVDQQTDGVLVHGENFQALLLMRARYRKQVKCIYIDPPYNTDASAILYKNDYKHSSWISLIENRITAALSILESDGILCLAIDDEEASEARQVLDSLFPKIVGIAVVRSNPQSRKTKGKFSPVHEYALFFGASPQSVPGSLEITEKRLARYPKEDEKGRFAWMNFIRTGNNDKREDRPKLYYPIFVAQDDTIRVPAMTWSSATGENGEYVLHESPRNKEIVVAPIDEGNGNPIEKNWHRGPDRVSTEPEEFRIRRDVNGKVSIDFKTRMDENSAPMTWWDHNEYASANYGAAELKSLFGHKPFDFPKALSLVVDCLRAANASPKATIMDFFAGSGTSGHAVIKLNREDDGRRKFIVVETGNCFDTVLLPRIKKVTFTPEWKDGKPKRLATPEEAERSPRIVKVIRLESYEDALNNLETRRTDTQQLLLDASDAQGADGLKEQYLLRYMLDVETRGSQSLLNVQAFTDPTAYKLKVRRPGSDESREVKVDLLETFNWLIGITVKHIAAPQTFSAAFERDSEKRLHLKGRLKQNADGPYWFRTVTGATPDGRKTLIIWRKLTGEPEQDNLVLDEWFTKQGYSAKDSEFDLIYVNGGNNLENLKTPDDLWKVRLIEEDFNRLMFEMEGA
ncbi:MAG: site-specific DNA-methyltransferase [Nitrospira sp.]|nr:MAG: site-specific DNA-methyltransferase [Nitrospira sp.]